MVSHRDPRGWEQQSCYQYFDYFPEVAQASGLYLFAFFFIL
jgi:hypothetical protein